MVECEGVGCCFVAYECGHEDCHPEEPDQLQVHPADAVHRCHGTRARLEGYISGERRGVTLPMPSTAATERALG